MKFILTNIVPQAPKHNRQAWNLLEQYTRKLLSDGNEMYIMAGTFGKTGEGDNGLPTTLGYFITVPTPINFILFYLKSNYILLYL
ncbi:MAG: DNA/RNA non-specific endonuclease [Arcicella sp.]|nr:DNA/RNA non-specific endonuclease [Arcicella sp.]